jgi:hypothetical protein
MDKFGVIASARLASTSPPCNRPNRQHAAASPNASAAAFRVLGENRIGSRFEALRTGEM